MRHGVIRGVPGRRQKPDGEEIGNHRHQSGDNERRQAVRDLKGGVDRIVDWREGGQGRGHQREIMRVGATKLSGTNKCWKLGKIGQQPAPPARRWRTRRSCWSKPALARSRAAASFHEARRVLNKSSRARADRADNTNADLIGERILYGFGEAERLRDQHAIEQRNGLIDKFTLMIGMP